MFPNLFNIAVNKEERVSSTLAVSEGKVTWNPLFRRALQVWELGDNGQLFEMLYAQHVHGIGEDKILWDGTKSRNFSVISYFLASTGRRRSFFPWKTTGNRRHLVE